MKGNNKYSIGEFSEKQEYQFVPYITMMKSVFTTRKASNVGTPHLRSSRYFNLTENHQSKVPGI